VYRSWRAVADSYQEPRVLVGEVWLPDAHRFADYLRPDEMHTAFNFDFMKRPWDAKELRESIQTTLEAHALVGAPATWVLSNHDITRPVTRYGREVTSFAFDAKRFGTPTDLTLGTRRARAAALLTAALPGCFYVYQGDELGLPENEDLPRAVIQDPMHLRSGGVDPGRDGCRVPLPWTSDPAHAYGFSARRPEATSEPPAASTEQPWLPQPGRWGEYAVDAQTANPASMLWLYRAAIAIRRREPGLRGDSFAWLEATGPENTDVENTDLENTDLGITNFGITNEDCDVLAFARGDVVCVVNFGAQPAPLPPHSAVLLASGELPGGRLPTDTAVWLRAVPDSPPVPTMHPARP
jgi:alpha-glucosidase